MTFLPETQETARWMVFSATPFRLYSTSGCQFGMARAKLTGRLSLKGIGSDYRRAAAIRSAHGARHLLLHLADGGRWLHPFGAGDVREFLRAGHSRGPARVRDGVGGGESSIDRSP